MASVNLDKLKTVGVSTRMGQSRVTATPTSTRVEHWDGRKDVTVRPRPVAPKVKVMK